MAPAMLELTIMAAEDLKDVAMYGKMNVYAVAWVDPTQRRPSTHVLHKGGRNPVWNETVAVSLEFARRYPAVLTVQIFSESSMGDKVVGTARILVQEILRLAPAAGDDEPALLTLQLQRPSGRPQGILSLSYKITGDPIPTASSSSSSAPQLTNGADKGEGEEPVIGIPVNPYTSGGGGYGGGYFGSGPGATSTGYPSLMSTQARTGTDMIPYAHPYQPAYQQTHYPYSYVQPPRPQSRGSGSLLLGLLGGALGGLILGDILT